MNNSLKNPSLDRSANDFAVDINDIDQFVAELADAHENTKFHTGPTNQVRTAPHNFPLENADVASRFSLDPAKAMECCTELSPHLIISICDEDGELLPPPASMNWALDTAGWGTTLAAAKLYGAALTRMEPTYMSECLNHALNVARGSSIVMVRYDKVFAIHSDGYLYMNIKELVENTMKVLDDKFGKAIFMGGHVQHSYVSGLWSLPNASKAISDIYKQALSNINLHFPMDVLPGARFYSSDTQTSAARLIPVFITPYGSELRLVDGVGVRHEHHAQGVPEGIEAYTNEIGGFFALFEASAEKAAALGRVNINHAANTVVGLCKRFGIPKKYGNIAYEEVDAVIGNEPATALDIYVSMCNMASNAATLGATPFAVLELQEKVAKCLSIRDWGEFDLAGAVTW